MKRALALALAFTLATSAFADRRVEKTQLIADLLELLDLRGMTQATFNELLSNVRQLDPNDDQWKAVRDRVFERLDYSRYAEEVYAPLLDENFNNEELQELIAFFKTKPGQKFSTMLVNLGSNVSEGQQLMQKAVEEVSEEIDKEENAKHPWRPTMADMRRIATCVEARATNTDDYPNVRFEELPNLLQPQYIRQLPLVDGWGHPYFYVGDGEHYRIVSAGADGRFDWTSRQLEVGRTEVVVTTDEGADIIFQDGAFLQAPVTQQH